MSPHTPFIPDAINHVRAPWRCFADVSGLDLKSFAADVPAVQPDVGMEGARRALMGGRTVCRAATSAHLEASSFLRLRVSKGRGRWLSHQAGCALGIDLRNYEGKEVATRSSLGLAGALMCAATGNDSPWRRVHRNQGSRAAVGGEDFAVMVASSFWS